MQKNLNEKAKLERIDSNDYQKEWLFLRDHICNKVFGAACTTDYANGVISGDLVSVGSAIAKLSHYEVESRLCHDNTYASIDEAIGACNINELSTLVLNTITSHENAQAPLLNKFKEQLINLLGLNAKKGDESINMYLADRMLALNERESNKVKLLLKSYLENCDQIKQSICRHASYNTTFYTQGPTNLHLNFNPTDSAGFAQMIKDSPRSDYYSNRNNNPESMMYLKKLSGYLTVAFFENKYLTSEVPPSKDKINFWVAINSLLDVEQKDYLSQIINAQITELNPEQKKLRYKILLDTEFQKAIINEWKGSFGHIPNQADSESINNGTFKMNLQQLHFILNESDSNLNQYQILFRDKFLEKAFSTGVKPDDVKEMINESQPIGLNKLKEVTNVLAPEKRTPIPSCVRIINKSLESEVANISVCEENAPNALKREIAGTVSLAKKKSLKLNKQPKAQNKTSTQIDDKDFIDFVEDLTKGKIDLDQGVAKTFLTAFYNRYRGDHAIGAEFLKKICNSRKTSDQFRNFIKKSIGNVDDFGKLNVKLFIDKVNNAKNVSVGIASYVKSYFDLNVLNVNKIKESISNDKKQMLR